MKISKLFAITLQSKTRLIFFAAALIYNLLLGVYLKDFLILSPMLLTFYLLSALPTLFLLIDVRSKSMRAVIFVTLFLVLLMNIAYALNCRRMIAFPTVISLMFEVLYFGAFISSTCKESFVTKICVLAVTALILVTLISAYNFVCKPEAPYLSNGGATLWDTQTEELADEILQTATPISKRYKRSTVGSYRTLNTTMTTIPSSNISMCKKHCEQSKDFALILLTYSPHSAVVKISLATLLMEYPVRTT